MKYLKYIGLLVVLFSQVANANKLILDSTVNLSGANNTQVVNLGAGNYSVQAISGAWNAWGNGITEGCDQAGFNCSKGWLSSFALSINDVVSEIGGTGRDARFSTAQKAFDNAPSAFTFSLATQQDVTFFISEGGNYGDNFGNLTVQIASPVPEASTYALMLSGLGMVAFMIRRRKLKL